MARKKKTRAQRRLIDYQRVSIENQRLILQRDAFEAAGVLSDDIYEDKLSRHLSTVLDSIAQYVGYVRNFLPSDTHRSVHFRRTSPVAT